MRTGRIIDSSESMVVDAVGMMDLWEREGERDVGARRSRWSLAQGREEKSGKDNYGHLMTWSTSF
jgi:hypothetical protein